MDQMIKNWDTVSKFEIIDQCNFLAMEKADASI